MKKSLKIRVFSIALVLVCLLLLLPASGFSVPYVDQSEALQAYEKLWNTFKMDSNGCPIYPDEYGGEYIDGNTLYVWLVDLTEELKEQYHSICDYSGNVEFLNARYSLNELDALKEKVMELPLEYHITGCVADRRENKLRIYLLERQEYIFHDLDHVLGGTEYIVEEGNYATLCSTNLCLGNSLGIPNIGTFTLGTCGTYNSQPAILTAGHCVPGPNVSIRYGDTLGTVFATSQISHCAYQSLGDFAIATIDSSQQLNFVTTNVLQPLFSPSTISGVLFSGWAPVGTNLYAYGKETHLVSGTVSQIGVVQYVEVNPIEHVDVNGVIQVTPYSTNIDQGDSGGPVFCNDLYMGNLFLGTLTGHDDYYFYYSPVSYAESEGFTVKTN